MIFVIWPNLFFRSLSQLFVNSVHYFCYLFVSIMEGVDAPVKNGTQAGKPEKSFLALFLTKLFIVKS